MGQPLNGREAVSVGGPDDERSVSVTGVGVPNLLLTAVNELERGDVLGARYQIEAVIGTGGSGRVLRAFDRESRMAVALKILRPEFASDPVWTERFSRELRIGRTITHPNVCRVFDIGDADGHKFLSMELASRGSIRADVPKIGAARVTPTRPLRSWAERVADAQAVVDGVAALHAAGIVHRDLKPENILRMEDGRLVVTDFGLATDPDAHGNTVMVGTPSYMAPEVVMGDPAAKRSDVWGLGVVLHEILFGCRPQWKPAGRGYRRFVLPDEVTTPVQRATAELCGRCADDSAELRPASALDVRDELARALRGKRRLSRARTRQIAWGVVAVAAFGALAVVRERWSNKAQASLSVAAAPVAERVLSPTGTPEDWSAGANRVASLPGRVHCLAPGPTSGTSLKIVWGEPRRAEDVDMATGRRTPSDLLRETYEVGCPQVSPDGSALLFEKKIDGASQIFLASSPRGDKAKYLSLGSAPRWLSNGQEFSFTLDSRHAAIFSIPTHELTIVPESTDETRAIEDQSPEPSGKALAVLYTTEAAGSVLEVRSLPELRMMGRFRLPQWSRKPRFDRSGNLFLTAVGAGGAREVISLDLAKSSLQNVGRVPDMDVHDYLRSENEGFFVARRIRFNIAREDRLGRLAFLTTDGHSVHGALSPNGTLAIQRTASDRREVIVLRTGNGTEEVVTSGPSDLTPSFLPDGSAWIHVDITTGQIIECSIETRACHAVHSDPAGPLYPVVDPSGRRIAYITSLNASRIRVIDRASPPDRKVIDLGPSMACGPVWTSPNRLWVVTSSSARETVWAEVDVDAVRRTGLKRSASSVDGGAQCPFPREILGAQSPDRIVSTVAETSDVWSRP